MGDEEESRYRYWDLNLEFEQEDMEEDNHDDGESDEVANNGPIIHEQSNTRNLQIKRKLYLTDEHREQIYISLLEKSHRGKLRQNTTTEISNFFLVPIRIVQRIWKIGRNNEGNVKNKKKENCGHPKLQVDLNRIMGINLKKRTTLQSLSEALGISYSTLYRRLKEGLIRRHSNTIKPHLKDEHKRARLRFCLSMLEDVNMLNEPKFVGMYNIVHIDEKWFYLTKKKEKYYLHPMEDDPLRTCQSKNFIGKAMFLVAMARPRFDAEGNETFSGKIRVFPLVTKEPAIRRSRNREAGTMVTKPIPSVTREVIRRFLVDKVIPKIKSLWPVEDLGNTIFIQQDNARTHIDPHDEEFVRATTQSGFDIRLMCQPANSPDLSILDLGFFSAIQSFQQKKQTNTIDELIGAVETSFEEYPTNKINRTWVALQLCMVEIMKNEGSNRYKISHMNKARLKRIGALPKQITCDPILVQTVLNKLVSTR